MKIKCPYCDNYINDTLDRCPYCGAPNQGVKRSASKQPKTIQELQGWYKSKGLPPYETTRFFIGEDYRKPRAFGIYQDPKTGQFVVYKNKDNGQRVIRYQGTDEAYAVNELHQRLKEEIIQQKRLQVNKTASQNQPSRSYTPSSPRKRSGGFRKYIILLLTLAFFGFIGLFLFSYQEGYYEHKGETYFAYPAYSNDNNPEWYLYDPLEENWIDVGHISSFPLTSGLTAKKCFLSEEWSPELGVTDFRETLIYKDKLYDHRVDQGYYTYADTTYYHAYPSAYHYWYYFDEDLDDWSEIESYEVPDDLKHQWLAQDFYYLPDWDSETQIYDFADSPLYYDYSSDSDSKYSSWDDNKDSVDSWDDDDDDWDWDWDDDWDSGSTDWDSDW